jgi:hypothetical protein
VKLQVKQVSRLGATLGPGKSCVRVGIALNDADAQNPRCRPPFGGYCEPHALHLHVPDAPLNGKFDVPFASYSMTAIKCAPPAGIRES